MDKQIDMQIKKEIDYYIQHNIIVKKISSLNQQMPVASFGHSFSDFSQDLTPIVNKVKNSQPLGGYLRDLDSIKGKKGALELCGINKEYKSKVINNRIKPSKEKLLCFAIAYELNLEETEELLNKAGYTLSKENSILDSIICYFIEKEFYSAHEIDNYLYEYNQSTLFSIA